MRPAGCTVQLAGGAALQCLARGCLACCRVKSALGAMSGSLCEAEPTVTGATSIGYFCARFQGAASPAPRRAASSPSRRVNKRGEPMLINLNQTAHMHSDNVFY